MVGSISKVRYDLFYAFFSKSRLNLNHDLGWCDRKYVVNSYIVHEEEEGANGTGAYVRRHHLHHHREQQGEPRLSWSSRKSLYICL